MEDLRAAFGQRIRDLRTARKLSQEALAERARLHWTYVSAVERGQRTPGLDVIGRLAGALRMSPAELFRPLTGKYRARVRKSRRAS
ncbi:MAG TPA: helix-turn-helix transcriptional regulator [Gemmatimonadaceae bacterium]|nr:helix-turn-helix transcriptional regulator [Gemmatimonadaceae bacterium]